MATMPIAANRPLLANLSSHRERAVTFDPLSFCAGDYGAVDGSGDIVVQVRLRDLMALVEKLQPQRALPPVEAFDDPLSDMLYLFASLRDDEAGGAGGSGGGSATEAADARSSKRPRTTRASVMPAASKPTTPTSPTRPPPKLLAFLERVDLLPPFLQQAADQLLPPPAGGESQAVPIIALVPEHLIPRGRGGSSGNDNSSDVVSGGGTSACDSRTPQMCRRGRPPRSEHLLIRDRKSGEIRTLSPSEYRRARRSVTNLAHAARRAAAAAGAAAAAAAGQRTTSKKGSGSGHRSRE